MKLDYRTFLKWTRTLHIYLTLVALLLLLFFAATGFILNHEDWFGLGEPQAHTAQGTIPTDILRQPDKLLVVERLRSEFGASGALDSFNADDETLDVVFKSPGRKFEATIDRSDGRTEIVSESWGLAGRLSDLHKGKAAGSAWKLIIDATCVFLIAISLTGLTLWASLRRRRRKGLIALAVGVVVCVAVYLLFVP